GATDDPCVRAARAPRARVEHRHLRVHLARRRVALARRHTAPGAVLDDRRRVLFRSADGIDVKQRFVALLATLALVATTLAPASYAQDTNGVDAIHATYQDMLDLFYKPVDARDLLRAGWSALQTDAAHNAAPTPDAL